MNDLPSKWRHMLIVTLVSIGVFVYLYKPYIDQFGYKPVNALAADWPAMQPAPEIIQGTVFRQAITPVESELRPNELHFPVCADLQFVNYANRKNRGSFSVALRSDSVLQSITLEAKDIEDNTLRSICFDQVPFETLLNQTVEMEIRGIDSVPGSAVSAVFSSKPGAQTVEVDGTTTPQTLVMHLNIAKDPGLFPLFSYTFLVFSSLLIAALSLAWRCPDHVE